MSTILEKRWLGRTGLEVTVLGFGCIKFPDISAQQAAAALDRAIDLGVNFVDTARVYGDSEEKIGRVLARRRDEVYIATKTLNQDAAGAMEELETSLKKLRADCLDLYQAHNVCHERAYDRVVGPGGSLETLQKAKQQGKIRHYGISMHRGHAAIRRAIEDDIWETIMLAWNPLDEEEVGELIPLAAEHELGVIVMKPLCGGALVSPPGTPKEDGMDPVVAGSLRSIAANPDITTVIPGMISVEQVDENYRAVTKAARFDERARWELFQRIAAMKQDPRYGQLCLGCGYCLPCNQRIEIPRVFRALYLHRQCSEDQRRMARDLYETLAMPADACTGCDECAARCPAGIDIAARMKEAAKVFGARRP